LEKPTLAGAAIELHKFLAPEAIVDLASTTKHDALRELAGLLAHNPSVDDADAFLHAIYKREELASTGVGLGVAIPHVKIPQVRDYVIAVGRRADGIEFAALDGRPVYLVFMIGASDRQTRDFVKMLARVMRLLKDGAIRTRLLEAELPDEFIEIIREDDLKQSPSP
jgi:mannitol/fructose-specific phosphotransferase system IIA component (Ntr-type)